jgi:hypothetical protein
MASTAHQATGSKRPRPSRPRRLHAVLAGLAALPLLLTASAGTSAASATAAGSAQLRAELAYARCMRTHGVTNFPDPDSQGDFPPFHALVSAQASAAARQACKHLLPHGAGGGAGTRGDREKLALALGVARCMRAHGFPTYPDPPGPTASSQGSGTRFHGTGIDTKSPRFQAAESGCETQTRRQLGLPPAR